LWVRATLQPQNIKLEQFEATKKELTHWVLAIFLNDMEQQFFIKIFYSKIIFLQLLI